MDIEQVRHIVADMLERTGHGNNQFIDSVRTGAQDDGPFMRAAMAVRDAYHNIIFGSAGGEPDE